MLSVSLCLGFLPLGLALSLLGEVVGGPVPSLVDVLGLDELAVLLGSPALRLGEVVSRPIPGDVSVRFGSVWSGVVLVRCGRDDRV